MTMPKISLPSEALSITPVLSPDVIDVIEFFSALKTPRAVFAFLHEI